MQELTGWQYLLIDVANNHHSGLDKKTFDERLDWATTNLDALEAEAEGHSWKERPLYIKAVAAVRKAQAGIPTGHMVGFDAVCSGMQLMSVLTGCYSGAKATGLVDKDRRADAYTDCTDIMAGKLGYHLPNERKKVKNATMTALYGSTREPKNEFGEDTDELAAFQEALYEMAPGACTLLQVLLDSWQPFALSHEWQLPDGFEAKVKVLSKHEAKIEVDELNHSTFAYVWYENKGVEKDKKNAANVVHSIDAYVLRSLVRRCSYDHWRAYYADMSIETCLLERSMMDAGQIDEVMDIIGEPEEKITYHIEQYNRSGLADIVILPYLDQCSVWHLSNQHLRALKGILVSMLKHKPFDIVTVHDDFKCHPNNMNYLRKHYRDILAELADSNTLSDILSQLYGQPAVFNKLTPNLSQYIREAEYALC